MIHMSGSSSVLEVYVFHSHHSLHLCWLLVLHDVAWCSWVLLSWFVPGSVGFQNAPRGFKYIWRTFLSWPCLAFCVFLCLRLSLSWVPWFVCTYRPFWLHFVDANWTRQRLCEFDAPIADQRNFGQAPRQWQTYVSMCFRHRVGSSSSSSSSSSTISIRFWFHSCFRHAVHVLSCSVHGENQSWAFDSARTQPFSQFHHSTPNGEQWVMLPLHSSS